MGNFMNFDMIFPNSNFAAGAGTSGKWRLKADGDRFETNTAASVSGRDVLLNSLLHTAVM